MLRHLALVSEASGISLADLSLIGAALQKQVTRDLAPLWYIQATVDCFGSLANVPPGYWPIIIRSTLPASAQAGIHEDNAGQPFALVPASASWSLSASHEAMEMLVDPFGQRTVAAQSLMAGQGRVDFLVEICDPCQASGYGINGVPVSDFFTPNYFDPVTNPAVRYSYTGAIKAPRQILKGGYLSWHDPVSGHWFQGNVFGTKQRIFDLGPLPHAPGMNFRSLIYSKTPKALPARKPSTTTSRKLREGHKAVSDASNSRAAALRKQMAEMFGEIET